MVVKSRVSPGRGQHVAGAVRRTVLIIFGVAAIVVFIISLNHLYPFCKFLDVSTTMLGLLWWLALASALVSLSWRYLGTAGLLFLFSFLIGYQTGPFLEPPADPLEHLRRVQDTVCHRNANSLPRANKGFWHYSMMGLLLCSDDQQRDAVVILRQIDLTHGLLWGILMVSLFVLGRAAGMPGRWALMSCLICFLFFGTNRFSYFKYYSFAPSFTSLLIYWLWTAGFFFRRSRRVLLPGLLTAACFLPVIWINHQQEAVFLAFIVVIWLLLNGGFQVRDWVVSCRSRVRNGSGLLPLVLGVSLLVCLLLVFFLLPQSGSFRTLLSRLFVQDQWQANQDLVLTWQGLYLGGVVWENRITDTLGVISLAMFVLAIPYFWPGLIRNDFEKKFKIAAVALLPFWGYCLPLLHFMWVSNVHAQQHWRLCYSSMFWLFFADCMRGFESWFYLFCSRLQERLAVLFSG